MSIPMPRLPACLPFLFIATLASAGEEISLPSGVDYSRLKNLEQGRHQKMKVYVNMVGIGEKSDLNLLIPAHAGKSAGTHSQMSRTSVESSSKYSAKPPQTPAIFL